jgi:hypothetical protein
MAVLRVARVDISDANFSVIPESCSSVALVVETADGFGIVGCVNQ